MTLHHPRQPPRRPWPLIDRLRESLRNSAVPALEFLDARARGDLDTEQRFFAGLLLRGGVFKTTHHNRLDDANALLVPAAAALARRPLRVLDVGCSSGVSTVELHRALTAAGVASEVVGTDLMTAARHVRRADGCALLLDDDEQPIQVEVGRWAGSWRWPPRKVDLAVRPARVARAHWLLRAEVDEFRAALHAEREGFRVTSVPLTSSLVASEPGVTVVAEDLAAPTVPGAFDVIRAANILNPVYFGEARLREMIRVTLGRLADPGLLLITQTIGGINHATLFRREQGAVQAVGELHGGNDVARLVRSDGA